MRRTSNGFFTTPDIPSRSACGATPGTIASVVIVPVSHRKYILARQALFHGLVLGLTIHGSRACGALQTALQYGNLSTSLDVGAYDYCADWSDSVFVTGCINCLRSSSQSFMANMISMLQVGCDQKPAAGSAISIDGSIFTTTLMNETSAKETSTWSSLYNNGPLSLGAEVGIAIGGFCFILAVAGFCIVCNGRRRRRAFLRKLEMRHKDSGWPHPSAAAAMRDGSSGVGAMIHRGADMNETPLSQKPLRGWDDSPLSATASEPNYARYFSPYSSQFSSPVTGSDTPAGMMAQHWPQEFHDQPNYNHNGFSSSSQEKAMLQAHHDAQATGTATPPVQIGVALGGDEKSLRTQPSNQTVETDGVPHPSGHGNNLEAIESYELHEVSSPAGSSAGGANNNNFVGHSNSFKNRMARDNRTPVLQHPGYGRYSPENLPPPPPRAMHNGTGGYRDEDGEDNRI